MEDLREITFLHQAPKVFTVTVAAKTAASPYHNVGSSNGYFINGIQTPIIELKGNDTGKPYYISLINQMHLTLVTH